jgi:cytochrome bd-type quinol oxidase subunit 2
MFTNVKATIARAWGSTTTHLLAVGMGIAALDPNLFAALPHGQWIIVGVAVAVIILRNLCPPPPAS